jgi:GAF domain
MLVGESQNLPPVLEMAEAVYRGSASELSPAGEMLAQRAGHFAAGVRFGLEQPQAMRRLHGLTKDLHGASRLDSLLPRVLDGALSLMGTDLGNIQLLDPVSGSLWLVTQSGFSSEFLNHFATVADGHSACGRAAKAYAQAVIADVNADASFARHREIAAASGFLSVQSTPLTDYAGHLIGMISTHFRRPYRPPGRDLRIMELYSDFAGEAVARHLGVPAGDSAGDLVGRAAISALLNPGDHQGPTVSALPGPADGRGGRGRHSMGPLAYPSRPAGPAGTLRGRVDAARRQAVAVIAGSAAVAEDIARTHDAMAARWPARADEFRRIAKSARAAACRAREIEQAHGG